MDINKLEDQFGGIRRKIRQMQYLCEIINDCGAHQESEEKLRFFSFTELLTDVVRTTVRDAIDFENALHVLVQESFPGSSLTSAAPITNTAPMTPSASICSRSSNAESSTATTGSM